MEDEVDPQSGFQQREPKLNIPPLQSEGVQFEATFSEPMMSELTYTAGPSSQLSFTEPRHTEIPPHQAPHAPDHAHWMDLSTRINSLGTRMEELAIVNDTGSTPWRITWINIRLVSLLSLSISSSGLSVLRIARINIKLESLHSLGISSRGLSVLRIAWINIKLASPHSLSISSNRLSILRIAWRISMRG